MNRPARNTFFGFGLCLAFAAFYACQAKAEFDSGNALFDYCSKTDDFSGGMCFGLATGYFEGFAISYTCKKISPEITRRQIRDIVFGYLQSHPEARHLPAIMLASRAYLVAFDCKEAK